MLIQFIVLLQIDWSKIVENAGIFGGIAGISFIALIVVALFMPANNPLRKVALVIMACLTAISLIAFVIIELYKPRPCPPYCQIPTPTPPPTVSPSPKTALISIDSLKNDQWIDVIKQKDEQNGTKHYSGHISISGKVDETELKNGKKIYVFVNDFDRGEKDGWHLEPISITTNDSFWKTDEDISLGDKEKPVEKGRNFRLIVVLEKESFRGIIKNNHLTNEQLKSIPKEQLSEIIVVHIGSVIEK